MASVTEQIFTVNTDVEQVKLFMSWAEKYKDDFSLPHMKVFSEINLEDVVEWLISNYREEEGEIIVRPKIYLQIVQATGAGLDCDDATIFLCALLRYHRIDPREIFIAEFDDGRYSHIFCGFNYHDQLIWLDNLPGSVFGIHNYDEKFLKVTPMADYL